MFKSDETNQRKGFRATIDVYYPCMNKCCCASGFCEMPVVFRDGKCELKTMRKGVEFVLQEHDEKDNSLGFSTN